MKKDEWQRHVSAQAESGKSAAAYCREHGLAESTFQYYRRGSERSFVQVAGRETLELTLPEGAVLRFPSSEVALVLKALRGV